MNGNSLPCAVVVTFHPDEAVIENVRAIAAECAHVLIVDNGSPASVQARFADLPRTELLALGENRGIAAALNVGARRAADMGFGWIITFDQDSRPVPGMIAALAATAQRNPRAAVVAPRILESGVGDVEYRWVRPNPRAGWLFQRVTCRDSDLPAVTMAITSGSLIEVATWENLGGFDEDLFIDYVDIDYCLRVVRAGGTVAVSAAAMLRHKLGARQTGVWLGHEFRPTHHAAFRHYFIARNRVHVWRRHAGAALHWALFDFCFALYNALRVVAFEPQKGTKLKAMLLGACDGFRGRKGGCPPDRARASRG
jgi:rhamnosyltransferase